MQTEHAFAIPDFLHSFCEANPPQALFSLEVSSSSSISSNTCWLLQLSLSCNTDLFTSNQRKNQNQFPKLEKQFNKRGLEIRWKELFCVSQCAKPIPFPSPFLVCKEATSHCDISSNRWCATLILCCFFSIKRGPYHTSWEKWRYQS